MIPPLLSPLQQLGLDVGGPNNTPPTHHSKLRRASVLVLIFVDKDEKLSILLTRRSDKLRSHPGEVCFPGGKQDEKDEKDDIKTALREAREEVGLDKDSIQPICRLRTLESVNHLCVTPIVGWMESFERKDLIINEDEVADVFTCPLQYFVQADHEHYDVEWSQELFTYRSYEYCDPVSNRIFLITGLTAHVAREVSELVYGDSKKRKTDEINFSTAPDTR